MCKWTLFSATKLFCREFVDRSSPGVSMTGIWKCRGLPVVDRGLGSEGLEYAIGSKNLAIGSGRSRSLPALLDIDLVRVSDPKSKWLGGQVGTCC